MQTHSDQPVMPAEASDSRTASDKAVVCKELLDISEHLKTQDNRITQNPMFCVQENKRQHGMDARWTDNFEWVKKGEVVERGTPGAEKVGYVDRWETVMVAFTEVGCQQYINLNGHNHRGELRIYVESYNRCPEMIAIREALMSNVPDQRPRCLTAA